MSERDLDVVVFGATGVTGRQVAAYLAERASETGLRWAAAARNTDKAAGVLEDVGVSGAELIAADVGDGASLSALAARTRVVLNLVGPYTLYGRPVIEACVRGGAHYADLTGELQFVRAIIDEFDRPAAQAGVKIVQVCGFESLPADLLVALVAEHARTRWGEGLAQVDLEAAVKPPPGLPRPSDGISGGTFQSLTAVAASEDGARITDSALLIDDAAVAATVRRVSPIELAPRRGRDGAVVAPMAPAPFINPGVIHRTEALTALAEGRPPQPFRYREGVALGGGVATLPARWLIAGGLSAMQVALRGLARARPAVRKPLAGTLSRVGPSAGFGPAPERLRGWLWTMSVHARTSAGNELEGRLEGDDHPGYLATARMLGEAGVLLAEDGATPERAGCLTPATALGTSSAARFERAGLRMHAGG